MKARHRAHALLETIELRKQDGAHPKQLLPDGLKVRMPLHQLFDASGKICPRGLADLQPEATQNSAQAVLEVQQLALHQLARRQHRADLLGRDRLAVDRPEPAEPHQLRDLARVVAVRLRRHRLEGITHVPRLQKLDRKASLLHGRIECDSGPVSSPILASSSPSEANQPISASGSLATLASRTILPLALTTHTLEDSNDTSIPA